MKTQSRTTKALQSLSLQNQGKRKTARENLGPRLDQVLFRTKEKQVREKGSKQWSRVGLLPTLGQDGTSGSQTTQQERSLRVSYSGVEGGCYLSSPASGPGRGSPGVLEFGHSQAFCAQFNTFSISLAVFQTLLFGNFFLSLQK